MPKNNLVVKLFSGNTQVKTVAEATHILISPSVEAPVIPIAERERDKALSALTFAQDNYRFCRYEHPWTDWDNDVHVYTSVDISKKGNLFVMPYKEDAATVGPNSPYGVDGWWVCDLVKTGSQLVLSPVRKLDPENHADEIEERMKKAGVARGYAVSWDKIDAARRKETKRAQADENRIRKHSWGQYYGYGFKIWIAHMRDRAELAYQILTEKSDEKAFEMRNTAIGDTIYRERHIAPHTRGVPSIIGTDTPDLSETEPAAKDEPSLVFPLVQAGKLAGVSVNLMKLPKGPMVSLWGIDGSRLVPAYFDRPWNVDNTRLIEKYQELAAVMAAGKGHYAVEFDQSYLAETQVG